jgi:hypothetical protein
LSKQRGGKIGKADNGDPCTKRSPGTLGAVPKSADFATTLPELYVTMCSNQ